MGCSSLRWCDRPPARGTRPTAGRLSESEQRVLKLAGAWLEELETTPMVKCFKVVVVEALLEAGRLGTGMPLAELALRCHALLIRCPDLASDLDGVAQLPDPKHPAPKRWQAYWKENPIHAWTSPKKDAKSWFRLDGAELRSRLPATPGDEEGPAPHIKPGMPCGRTRPILYAPIDC